MFITLIENKSKSPSVCSLLPTPILGSDVLNSAISKFALEQAMKAQRWSTGIDLLFL
jgi:hypothetical protein